jgi:hypothetical protein
MRGAARRPGDEGGQVVVLYAAALVPLVMVVALVLDLAQLRLDRRKNRMVADAAARAAVARLPSGPWAAACKARDYVLTNLGGSSTFDPGSETWSNGATPRTTWATSPCASPTVPPASTPCWPGTPATWAKLRATAGDGRITVEVQAGYVLPDPRFAEDARTTDSGDPARGSCDNVAVIITERRAHAFAGVLGFGDTTTTIRAVGRLAVEVNRDYVAALQLLEQHECDVLQTGGANTRVIVQPTGDHPGTIQVDSADDAGSCPQPIINGQATSGGPSIVACSTASSLPDCLPGTDRRPSRVGVYALSLGRPSSHIATPFPSTYGDTAAVATPRTGRARADIRYRQNVAVLDATVRWVLTGNGGLPPGCAVVVANACVGDGLSWLVLRQFDCDRLADFFAVAGRLSRQNLWFDCDLRVTTPLTLASPDSAVVVTGNLTVSSTFTVSDPRTVYIGGRATGNKVGLDLGGGSSELGINNAAPGQSCADRDQPGHTTVMVVGDGRFNMASGAKAHLCQTFVHLASGFGKVPTSDGTPPCQTTACTNYLGTVSISSGAELDWSAPNQVTGRQPTSEELDFTSRYEDLALWTEAGGGGNGLTGGAATSLSGIFFLPNADSFNLAGNGSLPIRLSAQFITTSLKVTGGAVLYLVPSPDDSLQVFVYTALLVR